MTERLANPIQVIAEGHDVLINYPKAFKLESIQPHVRLEIGPLGDWVPNISSIIQPYVAEHYPQLIKEPFVNIRTTTAERTFWEKATILHQEAHREAGKPLPPRYSRHYYDLYQLSRLPIRAEALRQYSLLGDVVRFKMKFYHCSWAGYEEILEGQIRLLPPSHHLKELKLDYKRMQAMVYGEVPKFEDIISELTILESEINVLL